eukprot:scaffold3595_cov235-Ochromonas_danica.AAC.3
MTTRRVFPCNSKTAKTWPVNFIELLPPVPHHPPPRSTIPYTGTLSLDIFDYSFPLDAAFRNNQFSVPKRPLPPGGHQSVQQQPTYREGGNVQGPPITNYLRVVFRNGSTSHGNQPLHQQEHSPRQAKRFACGVVHLALWNCPKRSL